MMKKPTLSLTRLGIDTYKESVIYMRKDCHICLSEGFEAHTRVLVTCGDKSIIATLNIIDSDLLGHGKAGLSEFAWFLLKAKEGERITVSHSKAISSFSFVRSKIYGNVLSEAELREIIGDIVKGYYSDINISSFLTACAGNNMQQDEIVNLTKAMIEAGDHLHWPHEMVVDKHCVGGLPGNRTTPIIVSIVAEFGLTMPKTSSRAITSPAGTADVMEVLTTVDLDLEEMKKVVEKENGCFLWGGAAALSPADDILIRVERVLDLDSESQMVASILSKKIAAGSNHVLIDIPVGPSAKVRSQKMAQILKNHLENVGKNLGIIVKVVFSDGLQPVGRGIGPALEARDVVSVLQCDKNAPQDLRQRAIDLAGHIIEFSANVKAGEGAAIAEKILDSGRAWKKFQAICEAQGGIRKIPKAEYIHEYKSAQKGVVLAIDNRQIALLAKLAGAPNDKAAGIDLFTPIGSKINVGDNLFAIHASSPGELEYALNYLNENGEIIKIGEVK